jgi:phosphonate utilization transcriptional regulator
MCPSVTSIYCNLVKKSYIVDNTMSSLSPEEEIALVRSRPLAALVQAEIERQILSGTISGGSRLNELEIARNLGISRAPVRESLRTLEQAGLVVSRKNFGVFVRVVSIEEAREIYEVRSFIDEGVGRELARRASPSDVSELARRVERMEAACAAGDAEAYHEVNAAFHERMVELVGNGKLLEIYRKLLKELTLYRRHSLGQPGAMQSSVKEHRALLASIAAGDADTAGKLMRDHILASSERLQRAHESAAPAASRTNVRKER